MEIRRIDNTGINVEPTAHDKRDQSQKRQQPRNKQKIPNGPVYKPNGQVEEGPPPKIDVLV